MTADQHVTSQSIDFSELSHQFIILRQNLSSSSAVINGNITTETQWLLKLQAKQTGTLTIPSFELNGVYTQPITMEVNKPIVINNKDQTIFLESSLNKTDSFVQEQLLYTLRLFIYLPFLGTKRNH